MESEEDEIKSKQASKKDRTLSNPNRKCKHKMNVKLEIDNWKIVHNLADHCHQV